MIKRRMIIVLTTTKIYTIRLSNNKVKYYLYEDVIQQSFTFTRLNL